MVRGERGWGNTLGRGRGASRTETNASHDCGFLFYFSIYIFLTNGRLHGSLLVTTCVVKLCRLLKFGQNRQFILSGSKGQSLCAELLCWRRSDVVLSGMLFFALQLGMKQDQVCPNG